MIPITGPITKVIGNPYSLYSEVSTSFRQTRPYDLVLPYSKSRGRVLYTYPGLAETDAWRWQAFAAGLDTTGAYNSAYDRLVEKLGDTAGLGITLVQWRQADAMIRTRANQLSSFTMALARRNPLGVASSLGLSIRQVQAVMRTRYGVARSLSDLWLEFWFGWKPFLSDIYTACEVFDQPIPWGRMRASKELSFPVTDYQLPSGPFQEGIKFSGRTKVSLGIDVRLVNPNLRLLNQFGLLNPALVAFDAVPWSFVFGWLSNVDSWLRSFTDFAGFETRNGYIATTKEVFGSTWWSGPIPYSWWISDGHGYTYVRESVSTLPRPTFRFKELSLRPSRALTAITLLVQKLPRR